VKRARVLDSDECGYRDGDDEEMMGKGGGRRWVVQLYMAWSSAVKMDAELRCR